jgi:ribulokinase
MATRGNMEVKKIIETGDIFLGIEFGSTRIKAVLTDENGEVLGTGIHDWENSFLDGIWTYPFDEILSGLSSCYSSIKRDIKEKYGVTIKQIKYMGISAMMHGYMAFDNDMNLLAPFQTWRNSNTWEAAKDLSESFKFNIPLRWTIAHLYQRIIDEEEHVEKLDFVTTLSSYIHYLLTGEKNIGIGDASGIFPIDSVAMDYDASMLNIFEEKIAEYKFPWKIREILPKVMVAGQRAGVLTKSGASLLDKDGDLEEGSILCPPEGDAGTGMVATNSIKKGTGNMSAGTSMFAMLVLDKKLNDYYEEIDMVTTPAGDPVAMSHANNGTSDLNAWIGLFREFSKLFGINISDGELFEKLYTNSLKGSPDCGNLMSFGYFSGEGITKLNEGRPLFLRSPKSEFNLANFMRAHLYSSLTAVKVGLDILTEKENVKIKKMMGHGGLFKTKGVGQRYLSAAINAPVEVFETASEGGAWGIALLALYVSRADKYSLDEFLSKKIFDKNTGSEIMADEKDVEGFKTFTQRYLNAVDIERLSVEKFAE